MWISLLGLLAPLASGICLSNGVPPAERKLLVNTNGDTYPLGVWAANYAASFAANTMVEILVEEVFGLNTTNGFGAGTVDGMYGVVPCSDPTNIADRGCDDEAVPRFHIHMECWRSGYPLVWEEIQSLYPKSAPVNLGNMGYNGESSEYVTQQVMEQAKQAEGSALEYYAYYNASWYDPAKYFDSIASINATKFMMPCSASIMADGPTAQRHVQFTGDVDGVVTENGVYTSLKCHEGYWWLAPSCRANASACVPYNTGGNGWGIEQMAQRVTLFNMPVALSVAKGWTEYTQYPTAHPGTLMFWWTPDPTFIELSPQVLTYPPHNRREWARGLTISQAVAISIEKLVSRDLSSLAPNVQSFVDKVFVTLNQMNDILRAQKATGESWRNVTCEWLKANEAQWRGWIPDESQCFPGFGLYDSVMDEFTDTRVNATNKIICEACPSGSFSQALSDDSGETFVCVPCEAGTSQPSGASLSCDPCKQGEYQDEVGTSACKRCPIGEYQDERGMLQCKTCPATTTTLGPGSVGRTDCGCTRGEINVNEAAGAFTCEKCSEGMVCPEMSSLADLQRGESDLGEDYTPMIGQGYYSTEGAPLEVYRCGSVSVCPGGKPNTCAGNPGGKLLGVPCAKCSEGSTWTGTTCEECAGWRQALWVLAVACVFAFLVLAYYLTTSKVTAKATVLFATTASFGMLVMSMQNLGLIGMMTVAWPDDLTGIFSICQFLLLDIDSYGFSCIAGQSSPIRYILSAAIFPLGVSWLALCWAVSQLLPKKRRWDGSKVVSCMGAFLQVGFSTMSATSLAPMMCYLHPNGQRSILKYPDVICGTSDHSIMLVAGWLLLCIFVLGFVTLCSFAVWMVPTWSNRRRDRYVAAVRFLVFRFRLDSWWFGVPLLVRGPLLSLPVVLATDYPPVQIMTITSVMACFLVMQMRAWPWKVPMLNMTDCVITFCITLLVTTSSLFLPAVEGPMVAFASGVSTAMLSGIGFAMGIMCCMTASALIYRGAMGGKKELRIFNLGKVANTDMLASKLKDLVTELEKLDRADLAAKISGLAIFDMNKITACITLLATEVAPPEEAARSFKFNPRIGSSSFDPSLKRSKVSKRSTTTSNSSAEAVKETEGMEETNDRPADQPPRRMSLPKSEWC